MNACERGSLYKLRPMASLGIIHYDRYDFESLLENIFSFTLKRLTIQNFSYMVWEWAIGVKVS